MPHFDPDSKDRKKFQIIKPREPNVARDVLLPGLKIFAIFLVLRLGMLAFRMPLFSVPLIDPALSKLIATFESTAERYKPR